MNAAWEGPVSRLNGSMEPLHDHTPAKLFRIPISHQRLSLLAFILLSLPVMLFSATHHDETIAGTQIWSASENPHVVSGIVTIERGSRLILEPGAIVYFNPDYWSGIVVRGSLTASGLVSAPIFFGANKSATSARVNTFETLESAIY